MNAKKARALALRNKERMDKRSMEPRLTSAERSEIANLRLRISDLEFALERMRVQLSYAQATIESAFEERRRSDRVISDLAMKLRVEYGLQVNVDSNAVVSVTEMEMVWAARRFFRAVQNEVIATPRDIVSARQRQIVLDEES